MQYFVIKRFAVQLYKVQRLQFGFARFVEHCCIVWRCYDREGRYITVYRLIFAYKSEGGKVCVLLAHVIVQVVVVVRVIYASQLFLKQLLCEKYYSLWRWHTKDQIHLTH